MLFSRPSSAILDHVWKALAIFFGLVALLQFYTLGPSRRHDPHSPPLHSHLDTSSLPPSHNSQSPPPHSDWVYDFERDANNPALTQAQCDIAFPDLYYEIDRAKAVWTDLDHEITPDDIDIKWRGDGAIRLLIQNNQLRILQTRRTHGFYGGRTLFMLQQIHRALLGASAAGEKLPDIEFSVVVDDMSLIPGASGNTKTVWTFTRVKRDSAQERLWLIPDFNFWSGHNVASSFQDMARRARKFDSWVVDKIPQIVWRGNLATNERVRGSLLNVSQDKPWADVKEATRKKPEFRMGMEDQCRYEFVVHTEGRSWSGRLKFLLNCDSVPIVHDLTWTASYYHLLIADGPEQNHIAVKRNFSNLEERVEYYLDHPDEAQQIAENAVRQFRQRYTTLAAETCYWRRLIRSYSEVAFKPTLFENVTRTFNGKDVKDIHMRGITFEEFVILDSDYPPPPVKPQTP